MNKTKIIVRTQYEGIHNYPAAPDEVKYLRQDHRHMFGVTVEVDVFDNDREIEFIMLKHRVDEYFKGFADKDGVWHMGSLSCEKVAHMLITHLYKIIPNVSGRSVKVTIDEDGENGAIVDVNRDALGNFEYDVVDPIVYLNRLFGIDPGTLAIHDTGGYETLAGYQSAAYKAIQPHKSSKEENLHWSIGLGEETGEVLSVIKHRYYSKDEDSIDDLIEELGDVLWHVAVLCEVNDIELVDVANKNLEKLQRRYPDGKFDMERSKNRHKIDEGEKHNGE